MKSDAYSQGSGLASSSAYTIALIKAISMYYGKDLTDIEICELSYKLFPLESLIFQLPR